MSLKPLGNAFVKLVRMLIAPIVLCIVAGGIAKMSSVRSVGRIGARALIYFEPVLTLALMTRLGVALLVKPRAGFNVNPRLLSSGAVSQHAMKAKAIGSLVD